MSKKKIRIPVIHRAAEHVVARHGGHVVVSGPVEFIRMPGDPDWKFHVAVVCCGIYPTSKTPLRKARKSLSELPGQRRRKAKQ